MKQATEQARWQMRATLSKYKEDIAPYAKEGREAEFHRLFKPYEVIEQEGNCLLDTGMDLMWDLITGVDTTNIFDNAHAEIGVGDDNTGADPAQTDLQAAANAGTHKLWNGMEGGFPTSTNQKATFKSSFAAGEANFAWEEWVIREDQSEVCLNRKAESLGTKSGGTWTLEVDITLS